MKPQVIYVCFFHKEVCICQNTPLKGFPIKKA